MDETQNLKSDVVGLLGAITVGVVMLSPAMSIYGVFGPTFSAAGAAAPLAFVWALAATLPTALSYVLLVRSYPLSGSAASWIELIAPKPIAAWCGWMVFFYYLTNFIIQPVTLGVFAGDFLTALGFSSNFLIYFLGALICCVWPASIVYRGISLSTKSALGFLIFESAVVLLLCLSALKGAALDGAHFDLSAFRITSSIDGTSGLFRALIFAMLAFCGFDVISTIAEETKMAKRLIPQATVIALITFAFVITFGVWSLSYGTTVAAVKQAISEGHMPISDIANRTWGIGAIMVSVTAISAALGLAIATSVGASRILFSMGRSRSAPTMLARLHPEFGVPWGALHLIFAVGLLASVISGWLIGPYTSYVWWGTTSTFFALLTYLMVHISNIFIHRKRALQNFSGALGYFLIPLIGISVNSYLLYRSFFVELWQQSWAEGKSIVVFDLMIAAGTALTIAIARAAKKN